MSELQISLIVLGVAIILTIVGFNWWQDRRMRAKIQQRIPAVDEDPLLQSSEISQAERREPALGKLGLTAESLAELGDRADLLTDDASLTDQIEEPDSVTDAVIELHLAQPMSGADLVAHLQSGIDLGRRPVQVFLQASDGSLSTRIGLDTQYMALQLAVLIANRHGPISAIEWSQLWNKAQALAEKLEASVDGPEQEVVLDRAAKLDNTCATLDAQVGLTVLLREQRAVTDVRASATSMGFVPRHGVLVWVGDHGLECFSLSRPNGEPLDGGIANVDRLTLLLDVPRSPANPVNFGRMLEVGMELARRVGAEVVDDQGRPLASGADVAIDQQLQALYAQLDAAGLTAGGVRARRVFAT